MPQSVSHTRSISVKLRSMRQAWIGSRRKLKLICSSDCFHIVVG